MYKGIVKYIGTATAPYQYQTAYQLHGRVLHNPTRQLHRPYYQTDAGPYQIANSAKTSVPSTTEVEGRHRSTWLEPATS